MLNLKSSTHEKLVLDRGSNVKGHLEVSPIADNSGFQMITVGEVNKIENFDPKKEQHNTTLFLQEGDDEQPVKVGIITGQTNRKQAGRIAWCEVTLDFSKMPRTREHIERYW